MFYALFSLCVLQRITELYVSKKNQHSLSLRGFTPREFSISLGLMVAIHVFWFAAMVVESLLWPKQLPNFIITIAAVIFIAAQGLRIWTIRSLGQHWNISVYAPQKAIEGVGALGDFVSSGPYKYIRHPNYLAVILEFASLPLIGGALITAIACSIMNLIVLRRRILLEEEHLFSRSGYREMMGSKSRFLPGLI